jgi:hypothetical protein
MNYNSLPVKKIYVDSRYSTIDSNSDSDFKIQLSNNIYLPDDCVMRIEHVCIPHSWYTIETGINDSMYLQVYEGSSVLCRVLTIPSTNYTGQSLQQALQTALNSAFPTYFTVSYDTLKNKISITIVGTLQFKILTDYELSTYVNNTWKGPNYDSTNPASCNDIITNRTSYLSSRANPFTSGCLNLQGFRSLYISSSSLCNFNTLEARGEQNIIKKVVTSSDFGYLIVDNLTSDHDYLNVSRLTLNTIDFQIKDVRGNIVPLHDSPVSFVIVFSLNN